MLDTQTIPSSVSFGINTIIHQTCYKLNNDSSQVENDIIVNYFHSLQDNDPALLQVDGMGMAPLHILCTNPAVTKNMIKQLYIKNTAPASVRNVNDMLSSM
jgi:hypothetical protein